MPEPLAPILSAGTVAKVFGVTRRTVSRWADEGKLRHFRTVGGHRRFMREDVLALFKEGEDRD